MGRTQGALGATLISIRKRGPGGRDRRKTRKVGEAVLGAGSEGKDTYVTPRLTT